MRVHGVGEDGWGATGETDFADLVASIKRKPPPIRRKREIARALGAGNLAAVSTRPSAECKCAGPRRHAR